MTMMCYLAFCSSEFVYHAALCLLVAGYLKIKPKKKEVASAECDYEVIHQFWYVDSYYCLPDISLCIRQYKTVAEHVAAMFVASYDCHNSTHP